MVTSVFSGLAIGLLSMGWTLIIFSTFNNFIGGVYMALTDPYGLELFPVEVGESCLVSRRPDSSSEDC